MKQTAVEFLQEALSIHFTSEQERQFMGLFQQVLEMEKEQIIHAHEHGNSTYSVGVPYHIAAEEYYNETYKKNNMTAVEWLINEMHKREQGLIKTSYNHLFDAAKEMEKEQMIEFAEFVATYADKNKNHKGEMLHAKSKYDESERTLDLLKIFTNRG
ncbi:hypothetical protein EBU94_01655 [bacterium]|nr:hypothetical protein [bacterium]